MRKSAGAIVILTMAAAIPAPRARLKRRQAPGPYIGVIIIPLLYAYLVVPRLATASWRGGPGIGGDRRRHPPADRVSALQPVGHVRESVLSGSALDAGSEHLRE